MMPLMHMNFQTGFHSFRSSFVAKYSFTKQYNAYMILRFMITDIYAHDEPHDQSPVSHFPLAFRTITRTVAITLTSTYWSTPYLQFIMNARPICHSLHRKRKGRPCRPYFASFTLNLSASCSSPPSSSMM